MTDRRETRNKARAPRPLRTALACCLAGSLGVATIGVSRPWPAFAQAPPAPTAPVAPVAVAPDQDRLTQAQLEQLLAPIALYPDDLLMQVLMAATYPLEVVQAKRWLGQGQNGALRGDALAQALVGQSWDPSVKSLVPFPDVLTMMNDQLEWTQQVGDAVLGQQEDVLNSVQVLRGRAQANGALRSGEQQTVNVTQNVNVTPAAGAAVAPPPQVITIAPANPETVYVPAYNPSVVYGTWPYPQYPPTYYPPPVGWGVGNAILTGMAFAGGVAVVNSLWGWGSPNWGRGNININANRYNNINVNRNQISGNNWSHDASHRHGVAYRNDEVRNRVNANRPDGGRGAGAARDRAQSREQFRGRVDQAQRGEGIGDQRPGGGDRPNVGDRERPGGGDRPNVGDRQRPGGGDRPNAGDRQRPGGGDRPNAGDRQRPGGGDRPNAGDRQRPATAQHRPSGRPNAQPARTRPAPQAMQGVGQGGRERAAAQRGQTSRQRQPAAQAQARQRSGGAGAGARQGGGGARAGARQGGGGGGRRQ